MSRVIPEIRSVVVEREVPFPPERIWRALTQPHLIAEWLMKNDFVPKVDHRFRLQTAFGHIDCQVLEIEPQRVLSYSWVALGLDSVVTWTLEPTAAGTRLRMEQRGFRPDQEQAFRGATAGWHRFYQALEQVLARPD